MDGCLNAFASGCVVDWDAWGAIGTLSAVVVALWLAGRDRRDRGRAESAEARLIATVISKELDRLEGDCGELVLADYGRDARVSLLVLDEVARARFEENASAIRAGEIRSLLGRLHLLPAQLGDELAGVLAAVENLRVVVDYTMPLLKTHRMPEVNADRVEAMVAVARRTQQVIASAGSRCQEFLAAPPTSKSRWRRGFPR